MNFDPYLVPYTEINLKWITDLNVCVKSINMLEENRGENFSDLRFGKYFLNIM